MLRARNKVGEGVLLQQHASIFVPWLAQITASANVRDCIDESAIQDAQTIRAKPRIDAQSIRAIAVKQHLRRSVPNKSLPINQRDRDFYAVRSLRVKTLRLILRGVVTSQHFLLFLQFPLASAKVVVEHAR